MAVEGEVKKEDEKRNEIGAERRQPRARQDLHTVTDTERHMNDQTAEARYQELLLDSIWEGKDPNDSEEDEEEHPGYVAPTWDPKRGSQVAALELQRLKNLQALRISRLEWMRKRKEHQQLPDFERIVAESEVWAGRTKLESKSASAGYKTRRSSQRDDEGMIDGGDSSSDEEPETSERLFLTCTPSYIRGSLRAYQIEGVNWLLNLHKCYINGILADEMGLGKTFQCIALLAYLKYTRGVPGPHLVVCPKSVLSNWIREFRRWCPSINAYKFHALGDMRTELVRTHLKAPIRYDVIVTTYDMILRERGAFTKINWKYLIVDEAHKLKNSESIAHLSLDALHTQHRLLMTGTPLQNDLKELWSLLHFLNPVLFEASEAFERWFDARSGYQEEDAITRMHILLRPMMLRRLKVDATNEIPPKKEIYVGCQLAKMQREWYLNLLAKDSDQLNRASGSRESLMNILVHLRKAADHPYLFPGAEDGPPFVTGEHIITSSGKMVILDKLLKKLKTDEAGAHKVLLFSQFTRMLDIIEDYLNYRGIKYCRIDGSTAGIDRDTQMAQFNNPKSQYFVFLLSTRAGGLGVNLQAANHVIIFDSDWNPQVDLQAQDRAHRIGQKRSVRIYRFITNSTVEERIYKRALKKLYLDAMVVQQGRVVQQKDQKCSKEELLSMIRFGAEEIFKSSGELKDTDIDALLEIGEKEIGKLHAELQQNQQASLLSFKLGVDEGGLYEFEGVNYQSNAVSKMIHVDLQNPLTEEQLMNKCAAFGEVTRVTIHPNLKEALVTFRTQAGANDAIGGLDLHAAYCIREIAPVVPLEMMDECFAVGEKLGRGQRVRRNVEFISAQQLEEMQTTTKVPPLRLPKRPHFPFWQLFNEARIVELYDVQVALLVRKWKSRFGAKTTANDRAAAAAARDKDTNGGSGGGEQEDEEESYEMTAEELSEREQLLSEGFPNWQHSEFRAFQTALASTDQNDYAAIAKVIGTKTEGEVRDYSHAFWSRGPELLGPKFAKIEQRTHKVRARVAQDRQLKESIRWKVEQYENPTEQLRFTRKAQRVTARAQQELDLDKKMFFAAYERGMKTEGVAEEIKRDPELRYDAFIQTRPRYYFDQKVRRMWRLCLHEKRINDGEVPLVRPRKRRRTEEEEEGAEDAEGGGGGEDSKSPTAGAESPLPTTDGGGVSPMNTEPVAFSASPLR